MANLYKKPILISDPKTGRKVKTKSKKWWGQYRDAHGCVRRLPLATDKIAAQAMLNELVRKAEREQAGLTEPCDEQRKRPVKDHLREFKAYLENKGVTPKQVKESTTRLQKIFDDREWKLIADISASDALEFLGGLRRDGKSAQTYNNYLSSAKQFTRWLVRDRRATTDSLAHLSKLNVSTDRRHDRRALTPEEFGLLVEAAKTGPTVETISGHDRAMMYVVAAWTGFRKGEIGSLTPRSLRLDGDPPTATVDACYSKRRRQDSQILHPEVVHRLEEWLATKPKLGPGDVLFPVSGRVPGGKERKTHKMMECDLKAARKQWIEAVKDDAAERAIREQSDFLAYRDESGLFADFHSNRHLFITSLERAGLSPKMAQTLARHSDVRLTLGIYTHVGLYDQIAAIESLPAPPSGNPKPTTEAATLRATGTDGQPGPTEVLSVVPTVVLSGAQNGAHDLAADGLRIAPDCTDGSGEGRRAAVGRVARNPDDARTLGTERHQPASPCITPKGRRGRVHPTGLEPVTFGSVDRCSIQLS
jgi:site-specific recombinase XerD